MKKIFKNIFYLGIASGCVEADFKKAMKTGLPVRKLKTELAFAQGELQVYFALLPEFAGKSLFRHKNKCWKPEQAMQVLEETDLRLCEKVEHRDIILAQALQCHILQTKEGAVRREVPLELMAAKLHACRPFARVCISLPEEGGDYRLDEAIYLLEPYLAGLHQVTYVGSNERLSQYLEEYLLEEYGMLMTRARKPTGKSLWLDLREEEEHRNGVQPQFAGSKYINMSETLKFLDTAVKNGYNTEVN